MPTDRPRLRLLRRSRALIASPGPWRARLVFWTGAVMVGLVSALFAWAADRAHEIFVHVSGHGTSPRLLLALPLAFAASAFAAFRFFPGAQGSGIPQAIAARELQEEDRPLYLTLRLAAGKIALTLWGLILAGSAAGIVFAIEEMGRDYHARTNGLALSAVVIAGIAVMALSGGYTREPLMLGAEPVAGAPTHALGLAPTWPLQRAPGPVEPLPDPVHPPCRAIEPALPLRGIREAMTLSAREDPRSIKERNTPATSPGGTEKPRPLSSRPAWRRDQEDAMVGVPPCLAGTPTTVAQPEPADLDA